VRFLRGGKGLVFLGIGGKRWGCVSGKALVVFWWVGRVWRVVLGERAAADSLAPPHAALSDS